jgi:predicted transcriptional regulator
MEGWEFLYTVSPKRHGLGGAGEMKQSFENNELIRLFGSTSRARILAFLFSRPHQSLYQREIMFETGLSLQAVQRKLRNLVKLGILKTHSDDNRVYYKINPASFFFKPLKEICGSAGKEYE